MYITPKSNNKRGANRRVIQNKTPITNGPNQLKTNIEVRHQFRFTSSSAAATTIAANTLLTACGVVASTAILGYSVNTTVKVNRVEIWSPVSAQGAFTTCSVLFPSTNQSQSREITDTSVSVTTPAHVVATPPPLSLCSFWNNGLTVGGAADPLFTLVAPSGSIIDVWVSLVLNDGVTPITAAVLVGATVGTLYYTSLDSSTSAGSIYKPVGLSTL